MKRVLIVTYYWPPSGGSGVQRWVKFAKYLPAQGWQPVVYTPENPELTTIDKTLAAEIPPEVEIVKSRIFEPYGIYRKLMGKGSTTDLKTLTAANAGKDEVNPINGQKKSWKQRLSLFIRGNFFIPDPRVMWVRPSVRFLKKYLAEHPVDAIVTTGPPQSMHLIGLRLSRATGIPWIADFRDPWTKMFYFKHLCLCKWAEKKHHRLEQEVLDDATVVVAVSPLVQEEFQTMTDTPVELITNGFDADDFDQVVEPDGYFNITHTGLFASDGNPEVLWLALAEKCQSDPDFDKLLRIRLVGKTDKEIIDSINAAGLGKHLINLGYQYHNIAVREQKNASLLILPLRKEPEYRATLPGKLFEYLASMNPILGIGQTDGAMARIVNQTGAGVVFGWEDKASVTAYLDLCWKRFNAADDDEDIQVEHSGETELKEILADNDKSDAIRQFSRKALTARMADLLNSITE